MKIAQGNMLIVHSVSVIALLAGSDLFKVNNRNTSERCEIVSELKIKTPERRQWPRSGVFIVNFEHISHLSVSIVNFEQVNSSWDNSGNIKIASIDLLNPFLN